MKTSKSGFVSFPDAVHFSVGSSFGANQAVAVRGILFTSNGRAYYRWTNCPDGPFTRPCRVEVEGIGKNGIIISVISGFTGFVGELVGGRSTRDTIIVSHGSDPYIYVGLWDMPMAARYQAVKIASLKLIASQKEA